MPLPCPVRRRARRSARVAATTTAVLLSLTAAAVPAQATPAPAPAPAPAPTTAPGAHGARTTAAPLHLDRKALDERLAALHKAGMYGVYAAVRDGRDAWRGAAGVADIATNRPVQPQMQQRIGSITKAFTSVAILQQVAAGRIDLDAPLARYLPDLVPGERGRQITVRMLLNHTSGIADYIPGAFPSLLKGSTKSLDDNRYRHFDPEELVRLGLQAPATGKPGEKWSYANTNYVIAGILLRKVTGENPEEYITRNVIRKAGLKHTYFPTSARISGPHSKMYESMYGLITPARDYSTYDVSWAGTAGALVATMEDVNDFYRALLTGKLLAPAQLRQMQTTVEAKDDKGNLLMHYGLGIAATDTACGRFWGHNGAVWGAETVTFSTPDGKRQMTYGFNRSKYQQIDEEFHIKPSPIDTAAGEFAQKAMCGTNAPTTPANPAQPAAPQPPKNLPAPLTRSLSAPPALISTNH
ncbi:alkaline D-peptidase [Streptomyces sp. NBRC 110611]|uniref:serine hydrolase domain-containing protein n=1 Tax=Streptomyces sp. NBRC 110611 TaxID=1621259 RepID=UPI0008587619|nr:serine hydrolase domain-containing protein [Streptomyces sp. NBRC 110611]GAU64735.1 alkaline D-peptidase [Streptomyces sp. NBRC 110611]